MEPWCAGAGCWGQCASFQLSQWNSLVNIHYTVGVLTVEIFCYFLSLSCVFSFPFSFFIFSPSFSFISYLSFFYIQSLFFFSFFCFLLYRQRGLDGVMGKWTVTTPFKKKTSHVVQNARKLNKTLTHSPTSVPRHAFTQGIWSNGNSSSNLNCKSSSNSYRSLWIKLWHKYCFCFET